ncbi:hypothetical protein QVD17_23295 [Tagetes erecta]|uniref:Uncharacterized protein n=1 Tax=Tagetes erecta TaxID=13708 RepID=A0AAD8NU28_TARER|nr:hypothetical protein QVD17_23295 [Tagetes erecta]
MILTLKNVICVSRERERNRSELCELAFEPEQQEEYDSSSSTSPHVKIWGNCVSVRSLFQITISCSKFIILT